MFLKRTAIANLLCVPVMMFTFEVDGPRAQQLKINTGCPSLGSPNIGQYTIDQLNKLCHNNSGQGSTSSNAQAAEDGAALTCGQHRALAKFARIDANFVEGVASQSVVDKFCNGVPDNSLPSDSQTGGDLISGWVRFERGYYTSWSGAKGRICKTYYSGHAEIDRGSIRMDSGGHIWRGTISQNSYISITRDGVTPRPKNHTVISGPMFDASLYNGYCGEGFFRLIAN
ncbi:MAG: hypothetical protein AAF423_11740 [Pseudomonadota bacterium]